MALEETRSVKKKSRNKIRKLCRIARKEKRTEERGKETLQTTREIDDTAVRGILWQLERISILQKL